MPNLDIHNIPYLAYKVNRAILLIINGVRIIINDTILYNRVKSSTGVQRLFNCIKNDTRNPGLKGPISPRRPETPRKTRQIEPCPPFAGAPEAPGALFARHFLPFSRPCTEIPETLQPPGPVSRHPGGSPRPCIFSCIIFCIIFKPEQSPGGGLPDSRPVLQTTETAGSMKRFSQM